MYKCKPERNAKQAVLLLGGSVLLTVGTFALGIVFSKYRGVINLIALLIFILAIYVIIRFTMTEMEYTLADGSFTITKIVGNKRTDQGSLDLSTTIDLVTKEEYLAKGYNKGQRVFCNYSQNLGGKHWYYVCEFAGKRAVVEFEPNDTFLAIMKDEIEKAKDNPASPPADDDGMGGILI